MEKKFFQKPTIYVSEVAINVQNIERSISFYVDFLGFKIIEQTNNKVVLSADGSQALLTLVQPEGVTPKEGRTTGLYHFAILLPSREDLGSFLHYIAKEGLEIGAADHHVSEALYFNDPDGNGIEVYRDRPEAEWEWAGSEVKMVTDPLDGEGILGAKVRDWAGMPEETIMGHIHLHVSDLEKTKDFYVNGLGLDVVADYPGALFLSYDGYHHHIAGNVWNGVGARRPSERSAGLLHYKLAIPDEKVLADKVESLQDHGYEAIREEADGSYMTVDPAGNKIKLQVY